MAKATTEAPAKQPNRVVRYLRETRAELTKVTWPTRAEWLRLSGIVLIVMVVMAAILGFADFVGSALVGFLVS